MATHEETRAKQTETLSAYGFGPAWAGGDWMSPWFATCNTCGAAVRIAPPTEEQPVTVHHRWHQTHEETR